VLGSIEEQFFFETLIDIYRTRLRQILWGHRLNKHHPDKLQYLFLQIRVSTRCKVWR